MLPTQLATIEEAKDIAAKLVSTGGGVADTYIPDYLGPYSVPENGAAKFYHFKFRNGADGFNVGLIRTLMLCFPSRWPLMVATEVNASANYGT